MKPLDAPLLGLSLCFTIGSLLASASAADQSLADAPPAMQQGQGHRFACTDYTQGRVFIIPASARAQAGKCLVSFWIDKIMQVCPHPDVGHGMAKVKPGFSLADNFDGVAMKFKRGIEGKLDILLEQLLIVIPFGNTQFPACTQILHP